MGATHMNTILGAVALASLAAAMSGSEPKHSKLHVASSGAQHALHLDQSGASPSKGCVVSFFEMLGQFR